MSRKFTVEVAGNKLSMEEVSEQQRSLIGDLQEQVARLQKVVAASGTARGEEVIIKASQAQASVRSVLWVDDSPRNNSHLVAHLEDRGIEVVTVLSTEDALQALSRTRFDRIISDMGRREGMRYNPRAGLDLLRAVRASNSDTPLIIFASGKAVEAYGNEARRAGATEITSSATSLLSALAL